MTLREFLDEVRCGNVGRMCVAICGEDYFFDNFQEGMYWVFEDSNWHAGSASSSTPDLPEEILEAEVTQVECQPNVPEIFANLEGLNHNNWNFTIVLVEEPEDFDAEEYWTEENLREPVPYVEWPYAINRKFWHDLQKLEPNWMIFKMAIGAVGNSGYLTLRDYTDKQFEEMSPMEEQVYRLAKKISWRVKGIDEVMALLQLAEMGSAFRKNVDVPCDEYESVPHRELWSDKEPDEHADDTYTCSACGADVSPTYKELNSGHFVCHNCDTVLNVVDYYSKAKCPVCGGRTALTEEEEKKGEVVCSHCGANLSFEPDNDTDDKNTEDEE